MGLKEILRTGKVGSGRVAATIDSEAFARDSDAEWQASLTEARDHVADHSHGAAVIDVDDFVEDSQDADWQDALSLAREHVDELEHTGRSC